MFDIGFWELMLLAVVGLVVIGPQRLPKVAYTVGVWFGKLQRLVRNMRYELEREFDHEEFRQMIQKQEAEIRKLKNMLSDVPEHAAVDDLLGDVKALNKKKRKIANPDDGDDEQQQPG